MDDQHLPADCKGQSQKTEGKTPHDDNRENAVHYADHRPIRRKHGAWVLIVFAIYLAIFNIRRHLDRNALSSLAMNQVRTDDAAYFNWTSVTPKEELVWIKCYDRFYCARLAVPLDYSDILGERTAVALIKLASKYSANNANYRGPILINPGGPGGSGVLTVLGSGDKLRAIIGDEFDFIGFDPRGVGFTTPHLDGFQTLQEAALLLQYEKALNATESSLGALLGAARIAGDMFYSRSQKYAKHVSTPAVARDMLSIVKAHGRDKLQYWGFSYGTVLGATFAAMFPDNVGRMIIDGVVDSVNYYATLWNNNLLDTDAELSWFYNDCVKAGPQGCSIYESTTELVQQRINRLLARLKTKPVSFFNASSGAHGIVDYSLVKRQLFATMYSPSSTGRILTRAIAALEKGDAELIWKSSADALLELLFQCDCSAPGDYGMSSDGRLVTVAIACGDGPPVEDSLDDLKEYYNEMATQSMFADLWSLRAECAGWKIPAKEQFKGKFVANTSHPLLLIGNTADPVTPLHHAHKMSKGFGGSVVLTQNSPGHCSVSATSLCTAKIVKEYFRSGTLPANGTVCEVESSIFGDNTAEGLKMSMKTYEKTLSAEDFSLLKASRALHLDYFVPFMF